MNTRTHTAKLVGLLGLAVAILLTATVCAEDDARTRLLNQSSRNENAFLDELGHMLKELGAGSRLYVHSTCSGDSQDLLFPNLELKPPRDTSSPLAALREALGSTQGVSISQRGPRLTQIVIGNVSDDLLRTRIHVLRLTSRQRYNFQDAIAAILDAKEVQDKIRELHMEVSPRFVHYPIVEPDPRLPHLPRTLNEVTMDEALDRVAESFGGVVTYEECSSRTGTRLFSVHRGALKGVSLGGALKGVSL